MYIKKIFLAVVLCMSMLTSAYCQSLYSEGFRGISWGTSKKDLPDLGFSKKTLKNIYGKGESAIYLTAERTNLAMDFENVPLLSMFLRFNDATFYGFDMVFKPEDVSEIQAAVASKFSTPAQKVDGEMHWQEDGVLAILTDRELMVTKR